MPGPEQEADDHGPGRLAVSSLRGLLGCAGFFVVAFGVPLVIAAAVSALSTGYLGYPSDVPTRVGLAWLPAAFALAVAIVLLRRGDRWRPAASILTALLCIPALVVTFTEIRNDAPDGVRFEEDFATGEAKLVRSVETSLDGVAPDEWRRQDDWTTLRSPLDVGCLDDLGRSRGAVSGSGYWTIGVDLDQEDLDVLVRELEAEGITVRVGDSWLGDDVDTDSAYVARIWEEGAEWAQWRVRASTPCLRE